MKKILVFVTLVITLISVSFKSIPLVVQSRPDQLKSNPDQIKHSSLLIVVESIQPTGIKLAYGMGTLVNYQGKTFLVTHNHWGDMLQDTNIIELRDSENRMIRTIYGDEFKSLIVYKDAGTMLLHAPDGLADAVIPGSLDSSIQLKADDTVQVAYRSQSNFDRLDVLDAEVKEGGFSGNVPIVTVRSLNGQLLQPGDSGGGVWHNGKLVANTWAVLATVPVAGTSGHVDQASQTFTELSFAAVLAGVFKSGLPALIQQ